MAAAQQLTVAGYFNNLVKIAEFIGRAAAQAGLDDQATYQLQMAVDEACTNIIEHAYGGEGKGQIKLLCTAKKNGLHVTIFDQGASFDPQSVPILDVSAPLSERQRRGMGLFLIYNLVDNVQYKFDTPEGNCLTLFKKQG